MHASVKGSAGVVDAHRSPAGPLAIGQWLVDPQSNELRRGSETVRIEPKAMDVLMLLAERAGRRLAEIAGRVPETSWHGSSNALRRPSRARR